MAIIVYPRVWVRIRLVVGQTHDCGWWEREPFPTAVLLLGWWIRFGSPGSDSDWISPWVWVPSQWKPIIQGWNFMFFSVGRECLLFQRFCFHQKSFNTCVFTYFSSLFDTPTLLNLRVLSAPRTIQICILGAIILHHMLEWLYKPLHFIQQIYCITWFFLAFVHQYLIELLEI